MLNIVIISVFFKVVVDLVFNMWECLVFFFFVDVSIMVWDIRVKFVIVVCNWCVVVICKDYKLKNCFSKFF